jgi:hypothetical protein
MIIEKACPDCSKPAIFDFNEKIRDSALFWSASLTCRACGYAVEMDDKGSLPDDLRSRMIAEEGLWELEIGSTNVYTMKAIHQVMQIHINELAGLKKQMPCVIYRGTKTEVKLYFNRMLGLVPDMDVAMRRAD